MAIVSYLNIGGKHTSVKRYDPDSKIPIFSSTTAQTHSGGYIPIQLSNSTVGYIPYCKVGEPGSSSVRVQQATGPVALRTDLPINASDILHADIVFNRRDSSSGSTVGSYSITSNQVTVQTTGSGVPSYIYISADIYFKMKGSHNSIYWTPLSSNNRAYTSSLLKRTRFDTTSTISWSGYGSYYGVSLFGASIDINGSTTGYEVRNVIAEVTNIGNDNLTVYGRLTISAGKEDYGQGISGSNSVS
ncbi:MAG: hypothetical protein ACRCX2_18140, partial [Paraclostridium sp.]